jgi:hypothetical protein
MMRLDAEVKKSPRLANQTRGFEPQALPVCPWLERYGYQG